MQDGIADGVLGLSSLDYLWDYATQRKDQMFANVLISLTDSANNSVEYFEIALPRRGEVGKFTLNGRANNAGPTARNGSATNASLLYGPNAEYTVAVQGFCFDGLPCSNGAGQGRYILDSLSHVIRTVPDLAKQVA